MASREFRYANNSSSQTGRDLIRLNKIRNKSDRPGIFMKTVGIENGRYRQVPKKPIGDSDRRHQTIKN